jgi:hypothetical protein
VVRGRADGITFLDLATGRELATIEEGYPLCFSADGSQLAAYHEETRRLMIWDLRRVREELAALKLDWDLPPAKFPVAASRQSAADQPPKERQRSADLPLRLTILDPPPK